MKFLARWMDGEQAWPGGCWPNEAQRLLLQACLLEDDAAATSAWRKWEELVPWDFIDFGSHRLLLLLHDRLRRLGLTSKDQGRLAGVARYYWVQTELRQRQAMGILQLFEKAQIPTLLLKGAALNATVYRTGFRAMNDLDVAVRREDAPRAVQLLNEAGTAPPRNVSEESFRHGHGTNFNLADGTEVDLHWDFFHSRSLSAAQQQSLWDASLPVKIGPASSRVLCPADQLLHTCEHGVRYNETPPFRWLADAFQITRAAGTEMDWQRIASQATEYNAVLQVRRSLQWLNEHLDLPIPDEALANLDDQEVSLANRMEYRVTGQRGLAGQHTFWQTFPEHVFAWHRQGRPGSLTKYHCLQHNISQNHRSRFAEFMKLGMLQTVSRVKAVVPLIRKRQRFVVSTLADDEMIGCHEVERSGHRTFRWTSGESTLVVTLPRGEYDVDVHVFPWRDWESDLASELKIDFNRHGCLVTPVGDRNRVLRFSIQRDMFCPASQQRLTFRCGSFRDVPEEETRHLGLPLQSVCFRPRKCGGTES
ncbi:nucleotidyltransferase domain-containing protein [Rhodopirellula europaea]|uniref:nucleotidyltransferase domain-containing protein n=1 Tax=Rhodopirellula europaea TaxID=1263866 RepID=UPI003D2BA9A3